MKQVQRTYFAKIRQKKIISKHEMEEIVAKSHALPPRMFSSDDRGALKNLDRDLKSVVVWPGQNPLITFCCH